MATTAEIRTWLTENGFTPGARGRLHPDHLAAWQAAHQGETQDKPTVQAVKAEPDEDSLTREEMETTITYTMADENVHVFSCIKRDVSAMKKDPNYTLVKVVGKGHFFTIPVDKFRFGSRKEYNLTAEQRAAAAERMAKARAAK